jgi:hypothetical protein
MWEHSGRTSTYHSTLYQIALASPYLSEQERDWKASMLFNLASAIRTNVNAFHNNANGAVFTSGLANEALCVAPEEKMAAACGLWRKLRAFRRRRVD